MLRYCTCENWSKGMPQIVAQQVFCHNQAAGPEYTGAKIGYCPWCGEKLSTVVESKDVEEEEKAKLSEFLRDIVHQAFKPYKDCKGS